MKEFKQRDVSEILASSEEPSIDGVVVIDHEGIIKSFDSAAQKLFGYDLAEVIDKPLLMLMSKAQQKSHPTYVQTANLKQHQTQNEKLHLEQSIIGLHKSGTPIPLSITVSSDSSGPQIRYTGVLQDLRKHEDRLTTIFQDFQANTEALKQRIEFESLLSTQGNKLLSAENHNFASAMEEALQAVCAFLNLDHGYIVKFNSDTTEAYLWAEWRRSVSLMKAFEDKFPIPSKDIIYAVFKETGCIVLDETNKDQHSELHALAEQLSPNGFVSTRIAAIYDNNHAIAGCIGFSVLDASHKPNEEQVSLLKLATQLLINAWGRHQLILEARETDEKIRAKNVLLETRAQLARILLLSSDTLYSMDHDKFQNNVSNVLKKASRASNHQQELIYFVQQKSSPREHFINHFLHDRILAPTDAPLIIEYINNQLRSEQIIQVADLSTHTLNSELKSELAQFNIASFTAVKMSRGDQYLGFICFYNNHPFYQPAEVELNFLQLTVQTISSAIEHHSTHYNLALSEQKLFTANQLLTQQALQDALTSLPNRRAFDTNFKLEFDRAQRHKSSLTLLMCDIDSFKLYNDYYGHPQGDECLKQVAKVLQDTFNRAGELSTRYGGEEFAIILPSITRAEAEQQAQRLITNLENTKIPHAPGSPRPYVTISVGIAQFSTQQNISSRHALLEAADQALYQAKMNGRNQLAWATEEE